MVLFFQTNAPLKMVSETEPSYGDDTDFPPIDQEGPRAPVARLVDFEDLSIDGSCYALSSICANINVTNKIGNKSNFSNFFSRHFLSFSSNYL